MVYLWDEHATEQREETPGKPSCQRKNEPSKRQKKKEESDGHSREKSSKRYFNSLFPMLPQCILSCGTLREFQNVRMPLSCKIKVFKFGKVRKPSFWTAGCRYGWNMNNCENYSKKNPFLWVLAGSPFPATLPRQPLQVLLESRERATAPLWGSCCAHPSWRVAGVCGLYFKLPASYSHISLP